MAKWDIPGWGAAQAQIREAFLFLCEGKSAVERWEIAEDIIGVLRSLARGDKPSYQASPFDKDEYRQEVWACHVADQLVGLAMYANERSADQRPQEQDVMLRQIARLALWHMPNAADEARALAKEMTVERMKLAHPRDDQEPGVLPGPDQ